MEIYLCPPIPRRDFDLGRHIMGISELDENILTNDVTTSSTRGQSLYERLGGRPTLEKVHKIFYDKLNQHPWLSGFFAGVNQTHIENQQSDFIGQLTGGPKIYSGRMPNHAHAHIYITDELFTVRSELLRQSLIEAGVPEKEREDWLKVDMAFKRVMVKESPHHCVKRYIDEEIVIIDNPKNSNAA